MTNKKVLWVVLLHLWCVYSQKKYNSEGQVICFFCYSPAIPGLQNLARKLISIYRTAGFGFWQCCGSGSAFILVGWIQIRIRIGNTDPDLYRIQIGQNDPRKWRKLTCAVLRDEDFSYSLDVLYGGLGISKLQFLMKKINKKISVVNIFQFLVIKTLDLDPDPHRKKLPDPHWNQCGSTTHFLNRYLSELHTCSCVI